MARIVRLTESGLNRLVKNVINEMYRHKPGEHNSDLMFKYGVDILPTGKVMKNGEYVGTIRKKIIPTPENTKYYVDNGEMEIDIKDTFEDALKDLLGVS